MRVVIRLCYRKLNEQLLKYIVKKGMTIVYVTIVYFPNKDLSRGISEIQYTL